jgi:hypothetical protein
VEPSLSLLSMTRSLNHGVLLSFTIPPPPLIPLPLFPPPPPHPTPIARRLLFGLTVLYISSRQSAWLFLQSSELGTSPLTRRRVCLSPHRFRGGHTLFQVKGWGVPIRTRVKTLYYSMGICDLWYILLA